MPDFTIFNDDNKKETKTGTNLKKLLKKKPFLIAAAGVSILGIISFLRKSKSDEGQNILVADGLSGVPVSPITGAYDTSYTSDSYEDLYKIVEDNIYSSVADQLSGIEESYEVIVNDMAGQMTLLSNRYNTMSYILEEQSKEIQKQNDIQAMMNNSDAWHYATSDDRKNALSQANKEIASKWGWTFDDVTGYWSDENGNKLYKTATQTVAEEVYTPTAKTSSVSVSKQDDINKMISNSNAWHSASDTEKKAFEEQNRQIASKYGFTHDSSTGYWYDASGNKVYTPTATGSTSSTKSTSSGSKATVPTTNQSAFINNVVTSGTPTTIKTGSSSSGSKSTSTGTKTVSSEVAYNSAQDRIKRMRAGLY